MFPSRERFHPLEPAADRRLVLGDIKAELFGRIIQISAHRDVGDCRLVPDEELPARQAFIDDRKISIDPSLEKCEHRRIAGWFSENLQKPKRPQKAIDLLVIE